MRCKWCSAGEYLCQIRGWLIIRNQTNHNPASSLHPWSLMIQPNYNQIILLLLIVLNNYTIYNCIYLSSSFKSGLAASLHRAFYLHVPFFLLRGSKVFLEDHWMILLITLGSNTHTFALYRHHSVRYTFFSNITTNSRPPPILEHSDCELILVQFRFSGLQF